MCLLLCLSLCLAFPFPISAQESSVCVESIATELLNDALTHPYDFTFPNLSGKTLYLCNAVNPYALQDNKLIPNEDIEYYIVKTDDAFIACITLCYSNGTLLSATLDLNISNTLNYACSVSDPVQLITEDGVVYVKSNDGVFSDSDAITRISPSTNIKETEAFLYEADGNVQTLTVQCELTEIETNPVIPRASVSLSVPYVSQGDLPICWAAAAAAFGRYYKGDSYAQYTASALAAMVGVGNKEGTVNDSRKILSDIFGISTTYSTAQLSVNTTISLLLQSKPILALFYGSYSDTGEGVGHMVVISGYNDNSSNIKLYVRDSNYTSIKTVIVYSRSVVMDYYEGIIMWWKESAY